MTSGSEVVSRFQYAGGHQQITANPREMAGPGWQGAIHGQQAVSIVAYYCMQHCVLNLGCVFDCNFNGISGEQRNVLGTFGKIQRRN